MVLVGQFKEKLLVIHNDRVNHLVHALDPKQYISYKLYASSGVERVRLLYDIKTSTAQAMFLFIPSNPFVSAHQLSFVRHT